MENQFNQQSQAPVETAAPEAEAQTLESIAKELSVQEQAQQFTSAVPQPQYQPTQPAHQQQFRAPDPITDPEGYNRFLMQQTQTLQELRRHLWTITWIETSQAKS